MPPTALVVDADDESRLLLADLLLGLGYHVLTATSTGRALAVAHRVQPDVVLCDVAVPRLAGYALIDWLGERRTPLPVILMSSVVPPSPGPIRYLRKPFDLADVLAALAEAADTGPPPDG